MRQRSCVTVRSPRARLGLALAAPVVLALAGAAWAAAAAGAAPKAMPAWESKVQLHNFAGAEATEDGTGVKLYRLPKAVRDQMTEKNKHSGATGADQMLYARDSEIRFVLEKGEKIENVKVRLTTTKIATASFYWGDYEFHATQTLRPGKEQVLSPMGHGLLYSLQDQLPRGRFDNRVCRIVLDGGELTLTGIDGNVRPPKPEELAPVMMSYGTSITQGYAASRCDLTWNSLTARKLGYDLVNLGCSGTAYCEPAVADWIAAQKWDLAVLEISVNMVGGFTTEEFTKRATYMVNTLAKSHPEAPIVCISIFPWGVGDYWGGETHKKTLEFRKALEQVCSDSPHKNVLFVPGPEVLSFTGLCEDVLHPSDQGEIEIADKLSARVAEFLKTFKAGAPAKTDKAGK